MISEKAICELLSSLLPEGRSNRCFESDSEVIRVNGAPCLFTTDEFSVEDHFREDNPYSLGWNIAAGAISDILACGGSPLYYAHALTVNERWDREYLTAFAGGVGDVLRKTGARFMGGDCGRSPLWRCTASVIGSCNGNPVSRRGATAGDDIYLSGEVGAGNMEAALCLFGDKSILPSVENRFCLRHRESAVMRHFASSCIDTSDGVCAALNTLANINGCGYAISHLPYKPMGLEICKMVSLPLELLFLGECGEYELLLTVPPEREEFFLTEAKNAGRLFHRIGTMTASGKSLHENGRTLNLESFQISARDYGHPQEYLYALVQWLDGQSAPRHPEREH